MLPVEIAIRGRIVIVIACVPSNEIVNIPVVVVIHTIQRIGPIASNVSRNIGVQWIATCVGDSNYSVGVAPVNIPASKGLNFL